jgi:flagellar protein FlgJ
VLHLDGGTNLEINSLGRVAPTSPERQKIVKEGLERAFLSQMLTAIGPRPTGGAFGGGIGEEQFSSILNDIYADSFAKKLDLNIFGKVEGK